jgi:hypothetical protein
MSYSRVEGAKEMNGGSALKMALRVPKSRSSFQVVNVKIPALKPRIFAAWWAWRKEPGGDFLASMAPLEGERGKKTA